MAGRGEGLQILPGRGREITPGPGCFASGCYEQYLYLGKSYVHAPLSTPGLSTTSAQSPLLVRIIICCRFSPAVAESYGREGSGLPLPLPLPLPLKLLVVVVCF